MSGKVDATGTVSMDVDCSEHRDGSRVPTLPMELWEAIAIEADLEGLLSLSRTFHGLYETLNAPKHLKTWKEARVRSGIPRMKAPDMTDKWLAILLFSTYCCMCGKDYTYDVIYGFRTRLCRECDGKYFVEDGALEHIYKKSKRHPLLRKYLPILSAVDDDPNYEHMAEDLWFRPVADHINKKLLELQADVDDTQEAWELSDMDHEEGKAKDAAVRALRRYQDRLAKIKSALPEDAVKLSRWAEPRKEKNIANRRKEITERWIDVTVEELGCKRSERFLVKHLPKIDDPRPVTDDHWLIIKASMLDLAKYFGCKIENPV